MVYSNRLEEGGFFISKNKALVGVDKHSAYPLTLRKVPFSLRYNMQKRLPLREYPKGQFVKNHTLVQKIDLPIDRIIDLYQNENKNMTEIAEMFNVSFSTIKRRLIPYGIIRSMSDTIRIAYLTGRRKKFPKNGHGPSWRGGKITDGNGYIRIYMPSHPFCDSRGYVMEHRLIMEKEIGRVLKRTELVHHLNGQRNDNRPENFLLVIRKNHYGEIICPCCKYKFLIK
jgi:hypothetical protein